jgi:hypothetical protein
VKLIDLQLRNARIFGERHVIGEGTYGKVFKAKINSEDTVDEVHKGAKKG